MSSIAVIGDGIIGAAIALELLEDGHAVTVIGPGVLGTGAAAGSAGYLSEGEIFPLARPGILRTLPTMVGDPLGPLVIRPDHLFAMIGWGLRFLRNAKSAQFAAATQALAELNRGANRATQSLAARIEAADLVDLHGGLHVCRLARTFDALVPLVETLRRHGFEARLIERGALLAVEPNLSDDVAGALYLPSDGRCNDPAAFGLRLGRAFEARGGHVLSATVTALAQRGDRTWDVRFSSGAWHGERIVVAAGLGSAKLLRPLGYRVPLEAERGYHLMLPQPNVALRHPVVFEDSHFAATSMTNGLRLAGTVEFARPNAPMNPRRSDVLLTVARRYLPGVQGENATRWMGSRPSFPDSLPAIGISRRHRGLFYCFGHQHLGLTQAAISANVVRALVAGEAPPLTIAPFALERFA